MKKVTLAIVSVLALGFVNNAKALVVTTTNDASTLAGTILGSGVTISGTPVFTGHSLSAGTFTDGIASGIGMANGIILTSGHAADAVGPNNNSAKSSSNGFGGDSQLNTLTGYSTHDTAKLEFDFTTAGGNLFFDYVFASEEYNEWANTAYSDVFGFFLDGTNIALIPGTGTPVSINNVNGGNPFGTNAHHPEFFNNNAGGAFNLQYDGFTTVFTAQALGIGAGTHHIKLAIADATDSVLDSAVFIKAGTFSDTPSNPVPEPATMTLLATGLAGLVWKKRSK